MNITATGTSSLTSLYLQQLLETSGQASTDASDASGASDTVSISDAAQQAADGQDPFQQDLSALESALQSGDLTSARSQYAAMLKKLQQGGAVPADFKALGTALDSGDLTAATSALATVEKNVAAHRPPQDGTGSNPLKTGLDQLGSLIGSGDLSGAQSLFSTILAKLEKGASSTSQDASSGSDTSSTSQDASSTSQDALDTATKALSDALASGDAATSQTAYQQLLAQLQSMAPPPRRSLESVASSAYVSSASLLG